MTVSFHSACLISAEPLLVLIDYVPFEDLLSYLRKSRGVNDTFFKDPDIKPQTNLTSQPVFKICELNEKNKKNKQQTTEAYGLGRIII